MSEILELAQRMNDMSDDISVPGNVRRTLKEVVEALNDESEDILVRINTATSYLDEVSNDPNLAQYTRTEVWNLVTRLETLRS